MVGSRKQTDWKKIAWDTYEASFEVSLGYHKKTDVVVKVVESIPGDRKMIRSPHTHTKTEACTAEYTMRIPRD